MSLRPRTKPPATGLRYGALNGPAIGLKPGVVLPLAPPVHKPVPQTESTDGAEERALRGVKRLNNWLSLERKIPSEVVKALDKIEEGEMFRENDKVLKYIVYLTFVKAVVTMRFRNKEGDAELMQGALTSRKNALLRDDELFEQKTAVYDALGEAVAYIFDEKNVELIKGLEAELGTLDENDPKREPLKREWAARMKRFRRQAFEEVINAMRGTPRACYDPDQNPDAAPC